MIVHYVLSSVVDENHQEILNLGFLLVGNLSGVKTHSQSYLLIVTKL